MPLRPLSPLEIRVLGTLMEKARTVPDSYPLTLNSLVSGCNQKTSRLPLTQITETEAQAALDSLKLVSLVFESSGGRVARHEHNVERVVGVNAAQAALLGLLMLRGPQTAGELRINAERWHRFADTAAVESTLDTIRAMEDTRGVALVAVLPRAPGAREQRWMHLLGGPLSGTDESGDGLHHPGDASSTGPITEVAPSGVDPEAFAALERRVAALEALMARHGLSEA